jgi:hypothetical protein
MAEGPEPPAGIGRLSGSTGAVVAAGAVDACPAVAANATGARTRRAVAEVASAATRPRWGGVVIGLSGRWGR